MAIRCVRWVAAGFVGAAIACSGSKPNNAAVDLDQKLDPMLRIAERLPRDEVGKLRDVIDVRVMPDGAVDFGISVELLPEETPPAIDGVRWDDGGLGVFHTGRVDIGSIGALADSGSVAQIEGSYKLDPQFEVSPVDPGIEILQGEEAAGFVTRTGPDSGKNVTELPVEAGVTYTIQALIDPNEAVEPDLEVCTDPACDGGPIAVASDAGFGSATIVLPRSDGGTFWIRTTTRPLPKGDTGVLTNVIVTNIDVTTDAGAFTIDYGTHYTGALPSIKIAAAVPTLGVLELDPVDPCQPVFASAVLASGTRVASIDILDPDSGVFREVDVADEVGKNCPTAAYWDTNGHATAVAGIAAGAPISTLSAPLIGPTGLLTAPAPQALIRSVAIGHGAASKDIQDGIVRLIAKANGEPLVINASLAFAYGGDGASVLETMIMRHVGPGRVFVAAAGNSGKSRAHAHGDGLASAKLGITDNSSASSTGPIFVVTWWDTNDDFEVKFEGEAVATRTLGTVPSLSQNYSTRKMIGKLFSLERNEIKKLRPSANGNFVVEIKPTRRTTNRGWDVFVLPDGVQFSPYASLASKFGTLASPASAEGAIAVTGYATLDRWSVNGVRKYRTGGALGDVDELSSLGPSLDGRPVGISAPFTVVAPASTHCTTCTILRATGTPYLFNLGTSFASPVVAGIAAVVLSIDPTNFPIPLFSRTGVKDMFYNNLSPDEAKNTFGAGKADMTDVIDALETAIAAHPSPPRAHLNVAWSGRQCTFTAVTEDLGQEPDATSDRFEMFLWRLSGNGENTSFTFRNPNELHDYSLRPSGTVIHAEVIVVNSFGRTGSAKIDVTVP